MGYCSDVKKNEIKRITDNGGAGNILIVATQTEKDKHHLFSHSSVLHLNLQICVSHLQYPKRSEN